MNTGEEPRSTRARLLDAAARLVLREGVSRLTLEAAAREAGVSKGGLLYHFPSKDALIAGMVERQAIERFERELYERLEHSYSGTGSWTRAYADATFNPRDAQRDLPLQGGLLAAAANNPALLDPLRESYKAFQKHTKDDGVDPTLATVVRLASDGLWFLELLDLPSIPTDLRQKVFETLLEFAGEQSESRMDSR